MTNIMRFAITLALLAAITTGCKGPAETGGFSQEPEALLAIEFGGRASGAKQAGYFTELRDWAAATNTTVFFFEAFDEPWKGDPANPRGAEKHWGLFFVDRAPKQVMKR
jgi:hypothetical protein